MMNLAKEVFTKTQAPIMSHKSNWLDHASSLLLFSHPDNTVLCDNEKASQRLNRRIYMKCSSLLPTNLHFMKWHNDLPSVEFSIVNLVIACLWLSLMF